MMCLGEIDAFIVLAAVQNDVKCIQLTQKKKGTRMLRTRDLHGCGNGYNPASFRGNPAGVETEIKKRTNGNGNDFLQ